MARSDTHGQWTLDWVDAAQFMRLDAGAMRALSVEPQPGDVDKNASLLGIFSQVGISPGSPPDSPGSPLDLPLTLQPGYPPVSSWYLPFISQCKTAMGARLVRKWLKQPLLSAHDIEERYVDELSIREVHLVRPALFHRYELVEAFCKGYETRSLLRDEVLPKMGGDLDRLGRKFAARKSNLADVVSLYYFVQALPRLLDTLKAHEARTDEEEALLKSRFISPLELVSQNFNKYAELIVYVVSRPGSLMAAGAFPIGTRNSSRLPWTSSPPPGTSTCSSLTSRKRSLRWRRRRTRWMSASLCKAGTLTECLSEKLTSWFGEADL
jgi:DNA mismatch repair protein MSH2